MNLYFVYADEDGTRRIVTPELSGSLLPGITRDSLLQIAADLGYRASEGRDLRRGLARGRRGRHAHRGLRLRHRGGHHPGRLGEVHPRATGPVGDGQPGEVTMRLRKALLDLQTGAAPDPHGWMHPLG